VFATCGEDGLRVWELKSGREIVKVTDPSTAMPECLIFTPDGKSIISGRKNRAFDRLGFQAT